MSPLVAQRTILGPPTHRSRHAARRTRIFQIALHTGVMFCPHHAHMLLGVALGTLNFEVVHTGAAPHVAALPVVHVRFVPTDRLSATARLACAAVPLVHFRPPPAYILAEQKLVAVICPVTPWIGKICAVRALTVCVVSLARQAFLWQRLYTLATKPRFTQ